MKVQISGKQINNQASLLKIQEKLAQCDIATTHPFGDGFIFTQSAGAPGIVSALWTPYESNLDYFEAIAESDLYIVHNEDGNIDAAVARGLLYALSLDKPIMLAVEPRFDHDVSARVRHLILAHVKQYTVADVVSLATKDLAAYVTKAAAATSYNLTSAERALIRTTLRQHFRSLLVRRTESAPVVETKKTKPVAATVVA
jgi:hypothetical protein